MFIWLHEQMYGCMTNGWTKYGYDVRRMNGRLRKNCTCQVMQGYKRDVVMHAFVYGDNLDMVVLQFSAMGSSVYCNIREI